MNTLVIPQFPERTDALKSALTAEPENLWKCWACLLKKLKTSSIPFTEALKNKLITGADELLFLLLEGLNEEAYQLQTHKIYG
mgnify:FL=1